MRSIFFIFFLHSRWVLLIFLLDKKNKFHYNDGSSLKTEQNNGHSNIQSYNQIGVLTRNIDHMNLNCRK